MKTQGGGPVKTDTDTEIEMAGRFLEKGFTDAQAKLMAVWQNPDISSICSQMPNMTILKANIEACIKQDQLSRADLRLMQQLALQTESHYCAGCSDICESALGQDVPIAEVMRCLMYRRSYGEPHRAREVFGEIPAATRRKMAHLDYSPAEKRCPRNLAIGRLMHQALEKLA
jgi:predicted aldo/keto reductase-like oxidoreductase